MPARVRLAGTLYHPVVPPGAVKVSRPTRWGNPYPVKAYGRDNAIRLYRERLMSDRALLLRVRAELAGRDLACWCHLDQPCHGDVLLEFANDTWVYHGLKAPAGKADYLAYAEFVEAHMPAVGDEVIAGAWPLSEAVAFVVKESGCPFPCDHRPLDADQKVAFLRLVKE